MKVDKTVSGNRLDLAVTGRIDTTTAPQLEEEIRDSLDGIEERQDGSIRAMHRMLSRK